MGENREFKDATPENLAKALLPPLKPLAASKDASKEAKASTRRMSGARPSPKPES